MLKKFANKLTKDGKMLQLLLLNGLVQQNQVNCRSPAHLAWNGVARFEAKKITCLQTRPLSKRKSLR
ncbi:hypothetical protein AH70_01540 [Pediococcus damnosus LMG 28219]|uniref:Uncharacterized protein n=1 Tax=Pediococcus damnosus TaxID=51663 RepID=A0AAC9FJN6_9LACO|nr:Hypothetical protein ADU70_2111 [Pediococcus damnosus]AMV68783.1 Hypothetical protein ADU73_0373 [Pediococcus damnosus]KJU73474.1 hypothetical protein AH70_01540 [Pediococcus damnosus LMG 28219]PIO80581.1 hypothetical protein BSQ38_02460 [Pediococcus damnosus]PIO85847.1 hypothetical protein BSQ37_07805 [Pediococcus damnosus]